MTGAGEALLVIDMQIGFDDPRWGRRNNPNAEAQARRLLEHWRNSRRQVVIVRHDSTDSASPLSVARPGNALKPGFEPRNGDWLIPKRVNSAFIGTDLEARLRERGAATLVVVGLTTDHCVSTTARMAGNLGFDTYVVSDATATFERVGPDGRHFTAEQMHDSALASLNGEFATVLCAADVLAAL